MKLSHHNNSLIKMIAFVFGIATLLSNAAGNWPFDTASSKTYIDYSEIDDNNADRNFQRGYSFNDYLTIAGSYYNFGEVSKGTDKLRLRRNQFASVNLNKWMQCKSMQCWYGNDLLTQTSSNPNCCAMV